MEFFFNNEDHIGGVMVKLAFMPLVRWIVGSSPGRGDKILFQFHILRATRKTGFDE
jgi:hypothetical protein